ncbi:LCP family protein [Enterococcus sp. DIV0876]|uniref:LCP family protein n=1 Tax=Enterococcus sp. DIV0876 TaxID=2774633 RepID=UPI003D300310
MKSRFFKSFVLIVLSFALVMVTLMTAEFSFAYREASTKTTTPQQTATTAEETIKDIPDVIQVTLIGSDARSLEESGRSDTLMVAQYDTKKKQAKLLSIMRDCYVTIPGYGKEKINAAYSFGGEALLATTLKNTFDLTPDYYISVTFKEFEDAVDTLFPKGLTVDVKKELTVDKVHLTKGEQQLDGNQVLQYVRFRKDEEGDFGRIRRQQQVMEAIAEQAKSLSVMSRIPKAVGQICGQVDTNVPISVVLEVIMDYLKGETGAIQALSVPVDHSWDFDDNTPVGSVLTIDEEKNKQAIADFFNAVQ